MGIVITTLIATLGAYIFVKIKIPAGALIGSLSLVALYNIIFNLACFPSQLKLVVQALAGAFIGQSIREDDINELNQIIMPSIAFFIGIIILCFGCALMLHTCFGLDLATSLVSCVPGGITDMSIISSDLGADSTKTTMLQLVRYLVATIIMPVMAYKVCKHFGLNKTANNNTQGPKEKSSNSINNYVISGNKKKDMVLTILVMAGGSITGYFTRLPAGVLVFSLVAIAVYNINFKRAFLTKKFRYIAQAMAGAIIGSKITMNDIIGIRLLAGPALVILLECLMMNYFLGPLISKYSKLDLPTMIFASVPAGFADMALISLDFGGDAPKVTVLHLVRYVGILTVFPTLISIFCKYFG